MIFRLKGKKEDYNQKEDTAAALYLQAAENGDPEAQYNLGLIYLEGNGVKKNEKLGAGWIQKAANQGHIEAKKKLAWCYLYGRGVKQNLSHGLKLSQEADGTDFAVDMNKFGALIRK